MMKMSEEISALAAALSKAQSSIEDATKGTENDYFKSKYADLSAVRDTIRKPLAENELSIAQFPTTAPNGVSVETVLMHSSGQYMSASVWVPISKMDAHGIGSGITYARRYGLMSLLCLASEDDDGNAAVNTGPAPVKAAVKGNAPAPKKELPQEAPPQVSEEEMKAAMDEGQERAATGSQSLRAWWARLPLNIRSAMPSEFVASLKLIGAEADQKGK